MKAIREILWVEMTLEYYGLSQLSPFRSLYWGCLLLECLAELDGEGSKSHISTSAGSALKEKHDQQSYASSVKTVALCVSILECTSDIFALPFIPSTLSSAVNYSIRYSLQWCSALVWVSKMELAKLLNFLQGIKLYLFLSLQSYCYTNYVWWMCPYLVILCHACCNLSCCITRLSQWYGWSVMYCQQKLLSM